MNGLSASAVGVTLAYVGENFNPPVIDIESELNDANVGSLHYQSNL